jgi:hypothetical protein
MKRRTLLFVLLLTLGVAPALGAVRISDDLGGQIGKYLAKYKAIRVSGTACIVSIMRSPLRISRFIYS